ncbi:hypothetical protein HYS48_01670 [Candidatus Woesearchaeota archaeon]|nr:hypothetical protein [Candidatus Woesearchaeota archaeon]
METTTYTLKSQPEVTVTVPAAQVNEAESLIKRVTEYSGSLWDIKHPYLRNPGILSRTVDLLAMPDFNSPRALALKDEIVLRMSIYGIEQHMRTLQGEERATADHILRGLEAMVNLVSEEK